MNNPHCVLVMPPHLPARLFDADARARLHQLVEVDFDNPLTGFARPTVDLGTAEILITGWGSSRIDADVLRMAPRLRAIVHAAGSVRGYLDPACWQPGIMISTARQMNAHPVAEYAIAMILLAGKGVFQAAGMYQDRRAHVDLGAELGTVGNYHRRVGLVGASRTGRRVIELLRPHDLDLYVYDPYLTDSDASALGVTATELDDLLRTCDVVSLHAPLLPTTRHLLDGQRLGLLRDGAVLINTARGGLIDSDALIEQLSSGRIWAILDVTDPEPPDPGSPLFTLPNVILTPHIAGSLGNELFRMGAFAAREVENLIHQRPLAGKLTMADLDTSA